jgi:dTDP-4-amino-4,6-dideoxygalactose transaminase
MKVYFNELKRAYLKHKDEFDEAVIDTLNSGYYILGKKVKKFEEEFSNYIGSKYSVALNSGLDALTLAFRALGIGFGDEVIVPANTYIASILGITENRATPVLVEPDIFFNLDPKKIENKITNKTKAILVVHLYGQAANMKLIRTIADKYKLFIVEDCAQSHGAKHNNKMTGLWGDIGCFSFYPTKNIGAFGDSGAVVTDNLDLFQKIKMLRNYGSKIKYQNELLGINSRMDEIQASLLSVKLKYYHKTLFEKKNIANSYLDGIKNPLIKLPSILKGSSHVWHLFIIQTEFRDLLKTYLEENNILTEIHYPIPPHLSKAYSNLNFSIGSFPITEKYSKTVLSLPIFEGLSIDEVNYVIEKINEFKV